MKKVLDRLPMQLIYWILLYVAGYYSTKALADETKAIEPQAYELFFVNGSGSKISNADAILESARGGAVYKCQSVEAKISKSGTSISVRNVKRPKQ